MDNSHQTQTDQAEELFDDEVWQINDFSKKIGVHYNTVDSWFKRLEEDANLHYIMRSKANNQKVYDKTDLQIALFIKAKRDEKWLLDAIFDSLPRELLRPFPEGTENQPIVDPTVQFKEMEAQLTKHIRAELDKTFNEKIEQLTNVHKQLLQQLPEPVDKGKERQERFDMVIAQHRVRSELEKEAAAEWNKKSEKERTKKIGLFFKTEDTERKIEFINNYVNSNFESRLKEKFDMDGM